MIKLFTMVMWEKKGSGLETLPHPDGWICLVDETTSLKGLGRKQSRWKECVGQLPDCDPHRNNGWVLSPARGVENGLTFAGWQICVSPQFHPWAARANKLSWVYDGKDLWYGYMCGTKHVCESRIVGGVLCLSYLWDCKSHELWNPRIEILGLPVKHMLVSKSPKQ